MLTIVGGRHGGYCDGLNRRSMLKIGALGFGFGGLTLADVLRLQAAEAPSARGTKSIINVHLGGGPSHQDMWDLKPQAPIEYRGQFNPIKTNVSGIEICEHFPQLAQMADKFALVRGMVGSVNEHSSSTTQTGYSRKAMEAIGGAPAVGSVIAKLQGFNQGVAPFVATMGLSPGYLGPQYKPFNTGTVKNMLSLSRISADRLQKRSDLLSAVDNIRRGIDASGQMTAADAFTQQAVDVVLSGKMADALDTNKEDADVVRRYEGNGQGRMRNNRQFLMARRLVEAGVRAVSLSWGGWDTHRNNFKSLSEQLPALDRGLSALVSDLDERGMLGDVSIAIWGEFGRTPRVNSNAGRDHWPRVAAAFVAGGAIQGGRVVGASDRIASDADTPVHLHEVLATLYHSMGIDPRTQQIIDPAGRPRYLLDHREPISALL